MPRRSNYKGNGSHYLHPYCWLGLPQLPSLVPQTKGYVLLSWRQRRDGEEYWMKQIIRILNEKQIGWGSYHSTMLGQGLDERIITHFIMFCWVRDWNWMWIAFQNVMPNRCPLLCFEFQNIGSHGLELASNECVCYCGHRRQPYPGAGRPRGEIVQKFKSSI
jgi:hypothetical protein